MTVNGQVCFVYLFISEIIELQLQFHVWKKVMDALMQKFVNFKTNVIMINCHAFAQIIGLNGPSNI